jgi:membrane-bound ClpP family serine protease
VQSWILREPALCLGIPVYAFAAVLFPLHLGWSGASIVLLAAYVAIAGGLFTLADVLTHPGFYRRWPEIVTQGVLSLMTIAVPALLAFAIGQVFDHSEEKLEDELCQMSGYVRGLDTAAAEADDSFDVTPDCVGQAPAS